MNMFVPYDLKFLFLKTEIISIDSMTETNYTFHQFLMDTIVFEHCTSDSYMFCLKKSATDILAVYSYQLGISNYTSCRNSDG